MIFSLVVILSCSEKNFLLLFVGSFHVAAQSYTIYSLDLLKFFLRLKNFIPNFPMFVLHTSDDLDVYYNFILNHFKTIFWFVLTERLKYTLNNENTCKSHFIFFIFVQRKRKKEKLCQFIFIEDINCRKIAQNNCFVFIIMVNR